MITKSELSNIDDVGTVYFQDGIVLRGINEDKVFDVMEILESGLIDELVANKLFPKTVISDRKIDGYKLVLEHEKVENITYPYEWSPEMLRKAGLVLLKVNSIANKYGFEVKDAHPFNIVFKFNQPIFVDFGSFAKKEDFRFWVAYERFNSAFIMPLKLYGLGCPTLFKNLFYVSGKGIPSVEFYILMMPILRLFKHHHLEKMFFLISQFNNCNKNVLKKFGEKTSSKFKFFLIKVIFLLKPFLLRDLCFNSLKRKLINIRLDRYQSVWGTYHQRVGMYNEQGEIQLSQRMQNIIDIIKSLDIDSVTELAGNQGVLSKKISTIPKIKSVVCSDYDEKAIDILVRNLVDSYKVTPVLLDFMRDPISGKGYLPSQRLASDLVIALAVTHHLILSQSYNIESILSAINKYGRKYILIEFMPMGLYSPRKEVQVSIPDWYTEDWFLENLAKYGNIIGRYELEINRILYLVSKT